jgi:hypothetical protein
MLTKGARGGIDTHVHLLLKRAKEVLHLANIYLIDMEAVASGKSGNDTAKHHLL